MADQVGDIIRVTIGCVYTAEGQVEMTNHHYFCAVAGGTDTRFAVGSAVYTAWTSNFQGQLSNLCYLAGFKVAYVNRTPNPATLVSPAQTIGGKAFPYLPSQARPLIQWRTGFSGRKYRGRNFAFTPASDSLETDGTPKAVLVTSLITLAAALTATISSGGSSWNLVLAHRPVPPSAWTQTLITTAGVPKKWATQRRSGQTGRVNTIPPW